MASWGKGNAPASFNIGNIPIYPNGAYTPCVLTNCAEGYGLVNNAGDCYLKLDGNNDHALGGDVLELNSVSVASIEIWFWQNVIDQIDVLFSKYLSAYYMLQTYMHTDGFMYLFCANGLQYSHGKFDYSTVVTAGTWNHFMMIFNGPGATNPDRLKVFINGVEFTPLIFNNTIPALTPDLSTKPIYIGQYSSTLAGRIAWFAIYSDADTSRPATNYAMGRDMELIGISIGNDMKLVKDICCLRKRRNLI